MTALFRCVLPRLSCVQMHRRLLLCALVLCVTTVDALRCYYGDDEDIDDDSVPNFSRLAPSRPAQIRTQVSWPTL